MILIIIMTKAVAIVLLLGKGNVENESPNLEAILPSFADVGNGVLITTWATKW